MQRRSRLYPLLDAVARPSLNDPRGLAPVALADQAARATVTKNLTSSLPWQQYGDKNTFAVTPFRALARREAAPSVCRIFHCRAVKKMGPYSLHPSRLSLRELELFSRTEASRFRVMGNDRVLDLGLAGTPHLGAEIVSCVINTGGGTVGMCRIGSLLRMPVRVFVPSIQRGRATRTQKQNIHI